MATSAVEKQTHRWRSVWQCLLKVEFVGSWLAGNTHLNTDSTEQQLGGKAFCAVVFPLVNLGRSGALMQLRPNKDELWDQTRATWFLTAPQTSHQPLRRTDKAAAVWFSAESRSNRLHTVTMEMDVTDTSLFDCSQVLMWEFITSIHIFKIITAALKRSRNTNSY